MPDGTPILSDETLIKEYSETKVDTLHLKNLFHLGEDRYLTSLMLERFPEKRMEYVDRAICYTIIPDEFAVLLSQRRRWINSTFHNLFELVRAKNKLCGTFICSMRLLVGLDFLSAMVTPVSLSYFYFVVLRSMILGAFADSLILFIGFLGLFGTHLVIIFLRKEFEFVMWMLIYIVFSMPIFSIVLPLYAFWVSLILMLIPFLICSTWMISVGGPPEDQKQLMKRILLLMKNHSSRLTFTFRRHLMPTS
jgi:chitin synthase